MSYVTPIGNANLIERLGTIPIPYPSYVTVIPTDDTYAIDDASISTKIRSQPDYITVMNPYNQLHSLMQNEFYQEICDILTFEYQYVIDNFNELKTLFDIDYYDGDVLTFLNKVNSIASEFNLTLPLSFVPYTNIENANGATLAASANVTKQNDFLRNIVRRVWLMRRWTGSLYGYKLPIKFINRIGAVHLGLLSISTGLLTNRIYRLIDPTQYSIMYPSSSTFPNSVNIPGAKSFNLVQNNYFYWDTQLTWDQQVSGSTIEWDSVVPITNVGKRIFIEVALERLITYINSTNSNPSVCLLENIYLDTVNSLLQYVNRVQDVVSIGSQLSLLTSKDGYFNTYSSAASTPSLTYTHPNIYAKFQIFPTTWNSAALYVSGCYVKIGTGGFAKNGINSNTVVILQSTATSGTSSSLTDTTQNWSVNWALYSTSVIIVAGTGIGNIYTVASNTTTQLTFNSSSNTTVLDSTSIYQIIGSVDLNVFNSCGLNGSASSIPTQALVQLKDIQSPIFSSPLLPTNEITNLGAFTLINSTVHSRGISLPSSSISYIANNTSSTMRTAYTTSVQLPNSYVAPGSVQLGLRIDVTIPSPTVSQTNLTTSNVVITSLTSTVKNTYYFAISIIGTTVTTSITMTGASNSITPIPITNGTTTLSSVMAQITAGLVSNSLYDWKVVVVGNTIIIASTLQELHQKITIYEQYNTILQSYSPAYKTLSLPYPAYQTPIIINSLLGIPTSGVGFSSITNNTYPYSFKFTLTSLNNLKDGQYFTINGIEVLVYSTDTYQTLVERITLTEILNWDISWAAIPVIINNAVVGYTYTIYMSYINPYVELNNYSIFSGYTTDSQYEYFTPYTYMSTAQMQCMNLLPLFGIDNYPSLYNNLVGDYRIDDGSTSALTDYTFYGFNGTTTGVTTGTNGYIPQGTYGTTQGYSGLTSYYYKYAGSGYSSIPTHIGYNQDMPSLSAGMTIAFSYNVSSLSAQSGSVIIAKQDAGISCGWGVYYTYAAGVATLTIYMVSSGGTTQWSKIIPTTGWHRILITINAYSTAVAPKVFIYIDSVLTPLTLVSSAYIGTYVTDASYPISIGGFSAASHNLTGWLSDIKIWNRVLLPYEITNESTSILSRLFYLMDKNNNSQYISIDHTTGTVGLKLQYNPAGLLSGLNAAKTSSNTAFYTDENYSLIIANTPIAISELGVFDSSNNLMAYATFPSIIYNPKNYHLALNLLIQN
jgi:hypothetical protein